MKRTIILEFYFNITSNILYFNILQFQSIFWVLHLVKGKSHVRILLLQRRQWLFQLVLYLFPFFLLYRRNFLYWTFTIRRYSEFFWVVHTGLLFFPRRWGLDKVFGPFQSVKFECSSDLIFFFHFHGEYFIEHSLEPILEEIGHIHIDAADLYVRSGCFFEHSYFPIFTKSRNPKYKDLVFPVRKDFLSFCWRFRFQNLLPDLHSYIDSSLGQVFIPFVDDESIDHLEW